MNETAIAVCVRNGDKILYNATAKVVSSVNEMGIFDILPLHSNFISIIKEEIIIHESSGGKKKIPITDRGVLSVRENKIDIFLGIGIVEV